MTAVDMLRAHSAEFEKRIYELAPNTYLAVGFAASNVGIIVGDDGVIVIDTTESTRAAENVLAELRAITQKTVKTIIYTHSHRDHISGSTVFADGHQVEIIAHHAFSSDLVGRSDRPGPHKILQARTAWQFGIGLEDGTERINIGIGPSDRPIEGLGQGYLAPNTLIEADNQTLTRCGVTFQLAFAPGECADNLVVFVPKHRVLFSADNFYASFPNLYAIRGTPYRDFDIWADSLSKLSSFNAEVLAPGHSRPIYGAQNVAVALADYEEAVRFVIAKCAEGMNSGLTPDALVAYVRLPDHLAEKPYLQPFYGTVEWSVRAYFAGTLGWFDGDPANLFPLPPKEDAERTADLAGGLDNLARSMQAAIDQEDFQWALQLSGKVRCLDPDHAGAKKARTAALRALAGQQINACARNYYLLSAKELERGD
ncbi:MAG: alkyl/aryl-sulfatase [Pseudomonadota bacterium]